MDNGHERAGRARILTAVMASEAERDTEAMSSRVRRALANLGRATDAFTEAERAYTPDDRGAYNRAALTVHLLNLALIECEQAGIDADTLRRSLVEVRRVYARSRFVRRLQTWPRGYPGDWETLDYLLDGVNRTPETEFAHHLERYALWCAAAQQHRNKVAYQAALCARVMSANPAAKILSIACGGSRDLVSLIDRAHAFSGALVLNDADPSALEISRQRLRAFSACCTAVTGRVLDLRARLAMLGPYDLVMAGGLFDYLSDALVIRLLRTAYRDYLGPRWAPLFHQHRGRQSLPSVDGTGRRLAAARAHRSRHQTLVSARGRRRRRRRSRTRHDRSRLARAGPQARGNDGVREHGAWGGAEAQKRKTRTCLRESVA